MKHIYSHNDHDLVSNIIQYFMWTEVPLQLDYVYAYKYIIFQKPIPFSAMHILVWTPVQGNKSGAIYTIHGSNYNRD